MLQPIKLRELELRAPPQAGRPAHLSAASGLVRAGAELYVIADDEHHLAVFEAQGTAPGHLIRLIEGELPDRKRERKALKPDFEALLRLPAFAQYAQGALLALGSGSRPQRQTAVLLELDAAGRIAGAPRLIDLAPLYRALAAQLGALNIEGALIAGDRVLLLQRGNKGTGRNAAIALDRSAFLEAIVRAGHTENLRPLAITDYALGAIDGVPLCFSDGAALADGSWLYLAIAENTQDSYADGPCAGAEIGLIGADGLRRWQQALAGKLKPEGIEVTHTGERLELLLVTDADDAAIPAALYSVSLAR